MQKSKRGLRASLLAPLTGLYFEHTVPRGLEDFVNLLEGRAAGKSFFKIHLQHQRDDFYVYEAWTIIFVGPRSITVQGTLKSVDNGTTLVSGRSQPDIVVVFVVITVAMLAIAVVWFLVQVNYSSVYAVALPLLGVFLFVWNFITLQYKRRVIEIELQLQ
ncbi:MAG: hypothetical protein K8L97_07500 [Anaerolineae bacterium]|nr:hypothetical protein [Anaerolineae bacterium]